MTTDITTFTTKIIDNVEKVIIGKREQIELLLPDGQTPSVPPPVMANYLAGALLTLLIWWLDNNMPYPPERMDEMFQALAMPGVWAALGITL